jgi:hypothetical protein
MAGNASLNSANSTMNVNQRSVYVRALLNARAIIDRFVRILRGGRLLNHMQTVNLEYVYTISCFLRHRVHI